MRPASRAITPRAPLRVLLIEDTLDDADLVCAVLTGGGYDVTSRRVETEEEMSAALRDDPWDIVLSDYSLPRFDGKAALGTLQRSGTNVPFVLVSGTVGEEVAVELMREGAQDFLLKGNLRRLCAVVRRELAANVAKSRQAQIEAQIHQSQRLEAIGLLAGGIAHDFNNVLTVIQSCSGFLLEDLPADHAALEDVCEIREAAERATTLTSQLLAFSRRLPQKLHVLDLNEILVDLDKMLRRIIGEDVDLVTKLTHDLGRVETDRSQIEQVLMNLAINAREAMPKGGRLTIETANVDIDETYTEGKGVSIDPGPHVMMAVSDTGIGMDAETQQRAFEPFFTRKKKSGTGLGLSTVYGIVKQSRGNIWIYSEPGQGTTFKIYLPRTDAMPSLPPRPARPSILAGTETVLLVEDEATVRRVTMRILKSAGYRVLEATNGHEALEIATDRNETIDLLLTDVVMPLMSGKELADRLCKVRPDAHVLFMSGYAEGAVVHHGVLDAGTPYVQKPFSRENLLTRVRDALDRSGA